MKILMITPYLPYPTSSGGHIRSYNLIKQLSKRHQVTLICYTREYNSPEHVNQMKKYCTKVLTFKRGNSWTIPNILRTGFSLYPFLINIYYSPEIKKAIFNELNKSKYDLIHAETFYVMPYIPQSNIPIVLVEQTIMSNVFKHYVNKETKWHSKLLLMIDVMKIRYWEKYYWQKANRLIAVSDEDAKFMTNQVKNLKVEIVPNGVGEDFANIKPKPHYNFNILYMGNYKWMQNWEGGLILAKKVFPIIKRKLPKTKLIISGQFHTKKIRSLASQKDIIIDELDDDDNDGVVNAYKNAGLLVAPIYGPGGTRLKILASMASMVPVVTTPIGAEGYGAIKNKSIMIGESPQDIAQKAIQILQNKKLYFKVAKNAKNLVDKNFTWNMIAQKLEKIYEQIT